MQIKRIFLGIVVAFTLNSCINSIDGNGNVINEKRAVSSYDKINISGGFEVILNQGDKEKFELEVDENLSELILSEVKNNTLFISSEKSIGRAKSLKLFITAVNLSDIDASGAIEIENKGVFKTEDLEIEISGAADVNLNLEVENLIMDLSGASETTLTGEVNNFEIEISGAGELEAKKLKTRNTSINISGAGNAIVYAKKTLKVEVSGAGSVQYKGNPKLDKSISGAGSISKI